MHSAPYLNTSISSLKPSLRDSLLTKPYSFEFAQAMRLLHLLKKEAHPLGTSTNPLQEVVNLKARIFLSAPPSDLYKIKKPKKKRGNREQLEVTTSSQSPKNVWYVPSTLPLLVYHKNPATDFKIENEKNLFDKGPLDVQVNFLGIAGIQGPLATPYTELLLSRLRQKDTVMVDFLNLFNHRLLSIHYRISQKLNPALHWAPPEQSPVGKALTRLIGVGTDAHTSFPPRDLLRYTRFFWKKPHTPIMLKSILQDYFGFPVDILPFQGRWFPLETYKQTAIGLHTFQNNIVGQTAVVGRRVWCQDQTITVCLTLNTPEHFLDFLPTGSAYPSLKQLIHAYVGPRFAVKLGVKLIQKPAARLSRDKTPFPFVLGWTSWLLRETSFRDTPWIVVS